MDDHGILELYRLFYEFKGEKNFLRKAELLEEFQGLKELV